MTHLPPGYGPLPHLGKAPPLAGAGAAWVWARAGQPIGQRRGRVRTLPHPERCQVLLRRLGAPVRLESQ